ncbi:MAG: ATP synthase F1 subunit epsilon [Proteobacteria bacterium]|nr:MAG: ATP synthase F1 subunit epsilon [Pseudomonadota bacterium]
MKLTILSPERKLADALDVTLVTLPGSEGQIQILPGHATMAGILETGPFSYQTSQGETFTGVISSGFFSVEHELIKVMAETFEYSNEIDLARAKSAQRKAETALRDAELDPDLFKKYELKLHRALIRQQIASKNSAAEVH